MGMTFFKNLLNQPLANSEAAIQAAIKASRPGSSLGVELRHFAVAAISGISATNAPVGFGFSGRVDGHYVLPVIDSKSAMGKRKLSMVSPTTLHAYGSFPVVRNGVSGNYVTTVRVPTGTTLSVVVSD
jgi:hypothetical protein